jgi:hypothetical protein
MCQALTMIVTGLYDKFTLENLNSLASSITYITAAYVGIKGLSAWRAQLKGNQDYKLAKRLMLSIYKYQEAMSNLRSPAVWASEYPDLSDEEPKMSQKKKRFKEESFAYQKRWDRVGKIKPKIFEQTLEGQVLWGTEIRRLVEDLLNLEKHVMFALSNYLQIMSSDYTSESMDKDDRKWMYDSKNDEDDIYRKPFKEKLKAVEDYLKPKLKL